MANGRMSKTKHDRQRTPEKKKRGAGRRPRDWQGTPTHHNPHEAELNSRGRQRLISPLAAKGQATMPADLPTNSTAAKGTYVTPVERLCPISSEQQVKVLTPSRGIIPGRHQGQDQQEDQPQNPDDGNEGVSKTSNQIHSGPCTHPFFFLVFFGG
ncbi:unnamed protein product [Schistocephalus solidus]|uniref:High mobility group protein HMGI-C n=1 Tax=Schistocephalus solidus TaxID=70667 RepID=A0A183TTX5_SCHSO|nr:unnamed protein product [Schistocephalus solidus]